MLVKRQELHHDVSLPLRKLAAGSAPVFETETQEVEELKVIPLPAGFKPANQPDPVLQPPAGKIRAIAPLNLAPVLGLNFEGLGSAFPNFIIPGAPPDTEGAVGATQYVQWVNTSFAVFDKTSGAVTLGPVLGKTLWTGFGGGCETGNDGDPIVTYDKLANRWVFTQLVVRSQPFLQCVAVSTTPDATGTYNRYSFEYSNFDDYPKLGVWPDAYYITFNMFAGGVTFVGADACAYDRNAMLQGLPATQICFQQASTVGGLLPADLDGHISPPAGSPNYMLDFGVNSLNLYKFHVDFNNPANSTFIGPLNIPVAPFTPFCPSVHACVPQPGGDGTNLDSLGDRLMYRLAYRNFGDHESLVVNHSVTADPVVQNSGIRWYEIQDPNGSAPTVAQQSTFAPDAGFRWMGSVAMDASGNLAVGYSVTNSASGLFPSIAFATRGAFDPPSTLQTETLIITGGGAQTGALTRWGDYSAMQVDPLDDCTFWYTSEYLRSSGSLNWNTRIANFKFPGCGATALSLAKSHAGTFTQGQNGATYTLTVTNIGSKPTDGTPVTVTDTLPAGLAATAISSADAAWLCALATLSCTRSDVLAPGASYPPIIVTVNVAADAPGLVTNTATVTGGGNKDNTDNTAADATTVIVTGPDPSLAITHVPLVQNQTATYAITVSNRGLSTTTAQPVTVTDTLSAGLTALAAGGTGWGTCTVAPATVSCTRSDTLAPNQSYPPITVSVSVGVSAPATVVNTATVSGGGDVNPLNNTVSDPAVVVNTPPGLAITNPAVPAVPSVSLEFKPGAQIAMAGTAIGPSFQDFRLEWAQGINPAAGWSSAGITLTGGSAPVTNGPLGTWDTTGITQAGYYSIRLTVDDAGFSNSLTTFIYLEPDLISQHWPVALQDGPEFYSGFQSLADSAGNQRLFLITPATLSGLPGRYLSFSPDGTPQASIAVSVPGQRNPAVGQLDGFPGGDAVVPNRNATNFEAQVQLFHSDNSSALIQLPASLNPITFNTFTFDLQLPVLEDMEGTGQLDFVSLAAFLPGLLGTDHAFLLALRPDGSLLSGNFPLAIPDQNPNLPILSIPRVLVGDLHGDGSKEFVVIAGTSASTFTLLRFSRDGTPIPWAVPEFSGQPAAMILADLDHNGMLETILTVAQPLPIGADELFMHVFQPDGSERPGWPVDLGQVNPNNFPFSHLMVGDLNQDGTEEIIEGHFNGLLHVLEPDGTVFSGFTSPVLSGLSGAMALADVDGDGFPEILLAQYQVQTFTGSPSAGLTVAPSASGLATVQRILGPDGMVTNSITTVVPPSQAGAPYISLMLLAVRRDGTVARTWTLPGSGGNQPAGTPPTIAVGDFNNDGTTEIALNYLDVIGGGTSGFVGGGAAMVLTTGTPFNAAANDWPLVYQNPRNTTILCRAITVALSSPLDGGTVAGIVPISATTTGSVQSVQFQIDGTNFGAPVTAAPFTLSWDTTQATVGPHRLSAVATDNTGRPVLSAPLTVNVVRGTGSTLTLALTAGAASSVYGDSLTFTATVSPNTATGSVIFFDGKTPISGTVPLSGGSAALTTSLLAAGTRNITAQYFGDSVVGSSISSILTQTVQPAPLTITANNSTGVYGGPPPTFTGSITGTKNGDALTLHFSTTATISFINGAFLASPPGIYNVTPSVTGLNAADYTITAVNGSLTITPATLTITAPDASRPFGTANPQFIPTITGMVPGDGFAFNAASTATTSSPVGQYPVIPSITGANISRYIVNAVNGTLTVTQAGSTAALATSSASANFGAPVTFTATVASATTGTPTGPVQFLDGATALASAQLNPQGVATLTTSSLVPGSHSITARYSGDLNFSGSLSAPVSQQVIAQGPDFAIAASPSSATIKAGASATFTFTVTPVAGFNQTVSFSCAGLPAKSQCVFAPPSLTPNGNPVTTVLTITTTPPTAALAAPPVPRNNLPLYASLGGAMFGILWIACRPRSRGRVKSSLRLLSALWLLALLTSCGGGSSQPGGGQPGTPAGTSQITVTATAGANGHTSSITLVVTN